MGKFLSGIFYAFIFWGFILVKAMGSVFAAWSWLWVFLPFVPWLSLLLKRMGLL